MDARERFLSSAAQAYTASVPALAAQLSSHGNELAFLDNNAAPSHSRAARSCQACGMPGVPGWNNHMALFTVLAFIPAKSKLSSRHRRSETATASEVNTRSSAERNQLCTECLWCCRFNRASILPRKRVSKASAVDKNLQMDQVMGNVSSRMNRNRNRKTTGLKMLLARPKEPTAQTHGLNLMDLMKPT